MTLQSRTAAFGARNAGLVLSAAVLISLVIVSLLKGDFGSIGPDGDDVMRLVEVRDLLNGQGWYDLTQPRLGPEGGTLMHWSRLVDLPIAVIAAIFQPFLGQEMALSLAITFWPLLSVLIVTTALVMGARAVGGRGVVAFVCLFGFAVLFQATRETVLPAGLALSLPDPASLDPLALVIAAAAEAQKIVADMEACVAKTWYKVARAEGVTLADCKKINDAFVYPGFSFPLDTA